MNPPNPPSRRLFLIFGSLIGLACGWSVVLNFQSRREEMAKLERENASLRAELAAAHGKAGAAAAEQRKEREAKAGVPGEASPPPGLPAAAADAGADSSGSKRRVDGEAVSALVKNPMMQKIMASQTSAVLQLTYGRLMDRLQLTPEEREHLQRLLVEKQTNLQNLGMQLMNAGLPAEERTGIMGQLAEVWKSGEAKIREFLNDEADFAYYQSYVRQEPERKEMGMFEGSLTGEQALDAATSDALAQLQNEARRDFPFTVDFYNQQNFGNPEVLNPGAVRTFIEEQTRFQDEVAGKAAGMLTAAQLEVFKQNQAAVRQMSSMQLSNIVQMTGGGQ